MLDLMRKHAKSWVVSVIIGLIAVVFVFWGAGSFRKDRGGQVATVNGDVISIGEYQEAYRRIVEMTRSQFGDGLNDEIIKMLNLKQQALDSLIVQRLIAQQAHTLGIDVLAEDLQREIAATPIFQVDGRFSPQRYQAMLSRLHYSAAQYEELNRQELVSRKVTRLVTNLTKVSPAEAKDYFHAMKDKIDLDFVLWGPDMFRAQVKITPEDLKTYFESNKEKYRIPAMAMVAFLGFKYKDFEDKVQVKDDEITEYYDLNSDKYKEPEQVRARHILFTVDPQAKPEDIAKIKAKAEEVLAKTKAPGADFAKLAQEFSQDSTSATGGDLGWFARDKMVAPFAEAAFKLGNGQISDLVKTQFGFHIIKTEERKPAATRTLEEAKTEIKDKLIKERAAEAALH
ncbi:MAG: SurA N-terminal domain-containing protein, partial [Deltaproteobacteria bacterium]|nr:SurA N-terminal domain-containing protein [Deltaproteobacteria bacterium]